MLRPLSLRFVSTMASIVLLATACSTPGGGEATDGEPPEEPGAEPAQGEGETDEDPTTEGSKEELAVGFVTSLSGPLAGPGQDMVEGFELFLNQNNGELGGRVIDLHVEDDAGNPETGLQRTTRLVQQVGVDIVVGPLLGNVGLAIGDYMAGTDTPLFYPIPSSDTFLRDLPETMFVSGGTAAQDAHPMGQYAWDQGYKKVVSLCQDYAFGHELCGGFTNVFTDFGGEIEETLWAPLGSADYGPFISQIQSLDYDALYLGLVGADAIKFVQAWNEFGLSGSAPVIASQQPLDQSLVRAMEDGALGMVSTGHFAEGRDSEATRSFVESYEAAYGKIPSYYAASANLAAQWLDQALNDTGGEIADAASFLDVVRTIEFEDTAFGPITLDDHGNVIYNVYVRELVEREDGQIWAVPIETIDQVGPAFNYDYDTYLSQPVYTREYQGKDWPEDCAAFTTDCPLDE